MSCLRFSPRSPVVVTSSPSTGAHDGSATRPYASKATRPTEKNRRVPEHPASWIMGRNLAELSLLGPAFHVRCRWTEDNAEWLNGLQMLLNGHEFRCELSVWQLETPTLFGSQGKASGSRGSSTNRQLSAFHGKKLHVGHSTGRRGHAESEQGE